MFIIAASAPFAFALIIEQVPQKLAAAMGTLVGSWILLLLVLNVFLLFVGLAMEMIASMVILVPLLVPILKAANIDLVHFGVVMVANLCIGALTPPLAVLVFTAARVTDTPIHLAYRACRPFMAGLLIWLAIISFVPALEPAAGQVFRPMTARFSLDRKCRRAAERRLGGDPPAHAPLRRPAGARADPGPPTRLCLSALYARGPRGDLGVAGRPPAPQFVLDRGRPRALPHAGRRRLRGIHV